MDEPLIWIGALVLLLVALELIARRPSRGGGCGCGGGCGGGA
jgi:hypothetical protein